MTRLAVLLASMLLVAACGGGSAGSPAAPGATSAPAGATSAPAGATSAPAGGTPVAPPPAGGSATDISLLLSGGPDDGTYEAHSTDLTCSHGLIGEDSWGNQYSDGDVDGFSSLQLIVDDATAAASGTSEFQVTVGMGVLFGDDYREYNINTRPDAPEQTGSGTVTIADTGTTARVTIQGETDDGVTIDALIQCNQVLRN